MGVGEGVHVGVMGETRGRCPVCFVTVGGERTACADCGTGYHGGCFGEGGCVVAGCSPRAGSARLEHSALWASAAGASAVGVIVGTVAGWPQNGWNPLLAKMGVSLALSCWCAGGGGLVVAGFQDLGWNIPKGAAVRPDRLGTLGCMALGLGMALVGTGCALRIIEASNSQLSLVLCTGAAGLLLVALALTLAGMYFDARRERAFRIALPLLLAFGALCAEWSAAVQRTKPAIYPVLTRPRS